MKSITCLRVLGAILPLLAVSTAKAQPVATTAQTQVLVDIPAPVKLQVEKGVTFSEIPLRWSQSAASNFSYYEFHASSAANFTPTEHTFRGMFADAEQSTFTDTWAAPKSTYYYKVRVFNKAGRYADSNEVSATTLADAPPQAVILSVGQPVTERRVPLSWTPNQNEDLYSYELHRSTKKNFTPTEETLQAVFEMSYELNAEVATSYAPDTDYKDEKVKPLTKYYYKVVVSDFWGQGTNSNEVEVTTPPDAPPTSVVLSADEFVSHTQARLLWTRNEDEDFDRFELHRSLSANFMPSAETKREVFKQMQTETLQDELKDDLIYFYKIVVFDKRGQSTTSNELKVNLPPIPVHVTLEWR